MTTQPKKYFTPEEYLTLEREAEYKSEYFDGEIFAMGGASRKHNLIALNIGAELRQQLKRSKCEVYVSDMRVHIPATGLYTYPDVVVACDEPVFADKEFDTLLNPTVVFEVLSRSTEKYDRVAKFIDYRTIDSLGEYLLVLQNEYSVEHYVKQPGGGWLLSDIRGLDSSVELSSVKCVLPLAEIFDKVALTPPTPPAA